MPLIGKTAAVLGGRRFVFFWTATFAFFILLERTGLFRFEPAGYRETFHSLPARILAGVFCITALAGLFAQFRAEATVRSRGAVMFHLGLFLLASGLWASYFTHFSGTVIKPQGEPFGGFPGEYERISIVHSRFARFPEVGIFPREIHPVPSGDGRRLKLVSADINYAGRTTTGVREGVLRSDRPLISDWALIWISDFGYIPRYALMDHEEKMLESDMIPMHLFPPGAEDSVRTQFLGYHFYLRLYPDYEDRDGAPASRSAELKNPMYNLRVVRNKDIIYSDLMKPSEKLKFDDVVISFPDVKPWIEITLVRDLGLPVIAAGLALLVLAAVLLLLENRKR